MIRFFHALFIRDWPLKIFSIALACLTWLAVTFSIRKEIVPIGGSQTFAERTFYDLPVVPLSADSDVQHYRVSPAEVDVVVLGDTVALQNLRSSEIRVVADLTGAAPDATNSMRRVEVITPARIATVRAMPEKVLLVPPHAGPTKEIQHPVLP